MRWIVFILSIGFVNAQQTNFFRTYSLGLYDVGASVLTTADTSYIVAGTSTTTGMNGTDMLLFKTNSTGDVTWWKNYGGDGIQSAKDMVAAVDGSGYYLAGFKNNFDTTGYDVWLVKTDLNGDTLWTKSYGGYNWEIASSIAALPDSTYIIAGETYSFGNGQRDVYVIKIKSNGDTLWTRTFGGTMDDVAKNIFADRNNNLLIIGNTESFGAGNSDVYVVYLDNNGDSIWTKTIGTADDDFGYSGDMYFDTSSTNMYFGIGYTSYYAPDFAQNSYILIIDTIAGNSISLHPQLVSSLDATFMDRILIRQDKPGTFYYAGDLRDSVGFISVIFSNQTYYGVVIGPFHLYATGGNESTSANDIQKTLDNGYVMTGYSENWGPGPTSCILLKTDSMLNAPNDPVISIEKVEENNLTVFPNPVTGNYFYMNSGSVIKQVSLLNLTGQLIQIYPISGEPKSLALEKPDISPGVYIIEIQTVSKTVYKKIVF